MNLTIRPSNLSAALKAAQEFVSTDPTSPGLNVIGVTPTSATCVRVTATDGYTAVLMDIESSVMSHDGKYGETVTLKAEDVERLAFDAARAKSLELSTFNFEHSRQEMPNIERVIPVGGSGETVPKFGMNMKYLARLWTVEKELRKAAGIKKNETLMTEFTTPADQYSPLRADMKTNEIKATVVIMLMRIG